MSKGGITIYPGYTGVLCLYHHITKDVIVQWTGLDDVDQRTKLNTEQTLLTLFKATTGEPHGYPSSIRPEDIESNSEPVEDPVWKEDVSTQARVKEEDLNSLADIEIGGIACSISQSNSPPDDLEEVASDNLEKAAPHVMVDCSPFFMQETAQQINEGSLHQCSVCGEQFTQRSMLISHSSVHKGGRRHQCAECGKWFKTKNTLRDHMYTHTGYKPHQCSVCGHRFTQRSNLNDHMTVHTGERAHKCTLCGKGFVRKQKLEAHMLSHTGDKPHKCTLCVKQFRFPRSLRKHMLAHAAAKPFHCTVCSEWFSSESLLTEHLLHHNRRPPITEVTFAPEQSPQEYNRLKVEPASQIYDDSCAMAVDVALRDPS